MQCRESVVSPLGMPEVYEETSEQLVKVFPSVDPNAPFVLPLHDADVVCPSSLDDDSRGSAVYAYCGGAFPDAMQDTAVVGLHI